MTEDGFREMPLLWERSADNDSVWTYRFLQIDNLLKEGEVTPDYPDENDPNFSDLLYEYWLRSQGMETGLYHYMNGATISNNGRFIATKMGVQNVETDAYATIYGAVIDIDNDTIYIFDKLPNATCLSVTNEGMASLATPEVEYFRYSYVASIENPDNIMPLEQYCLAETNGKVDLANYMMYPIDETYVPILATGTATLASEGTGFMTYQWNLIETGWQETFFVLFDGTTPISTPTTNDLMLYPNPTSGIVNIENFTSASYVEVFDIVGRKVYTSSLTESQLDLSHLSVGTYSVVLYQEDGVYSTKLIISK
jgi:hypothetical protein